MTPLFIYAKKGKIKALPLVEAKGQGEALIKEGWKHTHTLDACKFLEYLHNDCGYAEMIAHVTQLSNAKS